MLDLDKAICLHSVSPVWEWSTEGLHMTRHAAADYQILPEHLNMTIHDMTWHDMTWHDMTWHDRTCHISITFYYYNHDSWNDLTLILDFSQASRSILVILFVYLLQVPRDSVMERMYELQNPHIPTAIIQICCDCVPSLLSISLCSLGRGDDFHTARRLLQKRLIFSLTVKIFLEN